MANKYFKLIIFLFLFISTTGYALQPTPPPPENPIDGGVIGLLALGIGYAVKKIYDNSKE